MIVNSIFNKLSLSTWALLLIAGVLTFTIFNLHEGKQHWKGIVEADARGYYAYLPAVFIYQDLSFSFFEKEERQSCEGTPYLYDYRQHTTKGTVNKYFPGTAIAEMPFFLIAHGLSTLFNSDTSGYAKAYMFSIAFAGVFYCVLGLFWFSKILSSFKIKEEWIAVVLLVTVFGTNLFYYATVEPGMSHVYSFCLVNAFILSSIRFFEKREFKWIVFSVLTFGFIIVLRPINGWIIFALPFLAGSFQNLKRVLEISGLKWILAILMGGLVIGILPLIYFLQTGNFWVYSYGDEGFDFLRPVFLAFLFSYKKGMFLYTPVFVLCFFGLVFFWRENRFRFWSWLVFFFSLVWVLSSWWCWWYGGSFSSRVMVEFLPMIILPLALWLQSISSKVKRSGLIALLFVLTVFCQFQTYQYRFYLIHWEEMNKEMYWEVFLQWPGKTSKLMGE